MSKHDPVSGLLREITSQELTEGSGPNAAGEAGNNDGRPLASQTLDAVVDDLLPHREFHFDEEVVKQNLDEVLLMLIAMQEGGSHGKRLMNDLAMVFDARLSPGTVYPSLHDMEDEDVLEMHEKVRTKEYEIADEDEMQRRLEDTMYQHLALGFMMYVALGES